MLGACRLPVGKCISAGLEKSVLVVSGFACTLQRRIDHAGMIRDWADDKKGKFRKCGNGIGSEPQAWNTPSLLHLLQVAQAVGQSQHKQVVVLKLPDQHDCLQKGHVSNN